MLLDLTVNFSEDFQNLYKIKTNAASYQNDKAV